MYYNPFSPQCYYYVTVPMYNDGRSVYWTIPNEMEKVHRGADLRSSYEDRNLLLKDYGPKPFVVNINRATKQYVPYCFMDRKAFSSYFDESWYWRRHWFGNPS